MNKLILFTGLGKCKSLPFQSLTNRPRHLNRQCALASNYIEGYANTVLTK